jgi:HAD superfamily hydrolase (TIGR01509 family)
MSAQTSAADIRVLLFDVGGVLVELGGINTLLGWLDHRIAVDEVWRRWLESVAVRQFETGRIEAPEFAAGVIAEFGLAVEPREFLDSFIGWPTGLYPGALEMLSRIPQRYQRALLSNSNSLHWPRMLGEMGLGAAVDTHFVSHLIGRVKPDRETFEHVLATLDCRPAQMLFFDDNALNIEAARALGIQAVRVLGVAQTRQALIEWEIFNVEP